jgi:DNA-directed RNA polymerase subunit A"
MSHSHLIRDSETQKVAPIVGANMKEGMRIPVTKYIENSFIKNTIVIGKKEQTLDELFGWFIGAYLAEGNINYNEICITNISPHYIESTKKIAEMFGKNFRICEKQGQYGKSITSKFNSPEIAKLLLNTCGNGSYAKRVPDFAFIAPIEFKKGLFQGYFDGDGSINISAKRPNLRRIEISSSSYNFLLDIKLTLEKHNVSCPIFREKFNNKSPFFVLEWINSEDILKIKEFFYKNATIFLNRKKEKFDSFKIIDKK